jgi:hypothetical protein
VEALANLKNKKGSQSNLQLHHSSDSPHSGGFYNELAKSVTALCSANIVAEFIMSLQNL